jgi:STE24 endopeptidase
LFIAISAGYVVITFADALALLILLPLLLGSRRKLLVGWGIAQPADERLAGRGRVLAREMGVTEPAIYRTNSSRSMSACAFQIGSRSFSLIISDLLIEKLSWSELDAILAHELAHARKRHVLSYVAVTTVFTIAGVNFLLLNNTVRSSLTQNAIVSTIGLLFLLCGTFLGTLVRRIFEFEADRIAVEVTDPRALISALEKMATLNEIQRPTGWRSWLMFHPPLVQRIEKIRMLGTEARSSGSSSIS